MADRYLLVDDATGKRKRGTAVGVSASEPIDEDFTIGGGGAVQVTLATAITAPQKLDVFVNGKMEREGASFDWLRNVGAQRIDFNYTVPQNAWVRVRRYS